MSAVDIAMIMTGKNVNQANECLRALNNSLFDNEKFVIRSRGRWVSFVHAIELVMVLPGRLAKETRTKFANIIQRYLAGDHTLISEIRANAVSNSPVAQMARQSLNISIEEDLDRKRRREELELEKLQVEIQDQKKKTAINFVHSYADAMAMLDTNWKKDQRLVVQLKDYLTNATMGPRQIGNGSEDASDDEAIYVTMVAKELGYTKLSHGQDCKIGREMAKLYRAKYGEEPQTCKRLVNGTEMVVKHYTKRDKDMMQQAIKSAMQ